jgi:hypothetical protein
LVGNSAEQLGRQAETIERRSNEILLRSACGRGDPSEPVQADATAIARNSRELEDNREKAVKRTGLRDTIYLAPHYTGIG